MKYLILIALLLVTFFSNAQDALVKFKDGSVQQGIIKFGTNFNDILLTSSKKKDHILFKKVGSKDFKSIATRSITSYVVLNSYNQSVEYFAVPVRRYNGNDGSVKKREDIMFLEKIYDGESLEVYGSFVVIFIVNENGRKEAYNSLFFSYLKTKEMKYAVVAKSHSWGGVWPSFKAISTFLNKCPKAKAIFDEKYPNTLKTKRRFEKYVQKTTKTFLKEYKVMHPNYTREELRLANWEQQRQIHLSFYQEFIDLYQEHCVAK